jgi:hypothetical protein
MSRLFHDTPSRAVAEVELLRRVSLLKHLLMVLMVLMLLPLLLLQALLTILDSPLNKAGKIKVGTQAAV